MVAVHAVPYVVFRLTLFLPTEARAETEEGVAEGGRGSESYW